MKRKSVILSILFSVLLSVMCSDLLSASGNAGTAAPNLERYIATGLENNLALKQRQFFLKESLQALKEAKGMFLPSISIEARYSRAGGGRVIEMPIGDMVNPMQDTLNQLLVMHGAQAVFPANIPNEAIPFLRKKEHDTKLRIQQPVFQPGIYYNFKIKKELTQVEKAKLNAFKRQLVSDIKIAYYNYNKTLKVKELLAETKELLEENLRLNQSLFKNHKKTEEVVYRARAELSQLEQQQAGAHKNVRLAASYLNFLLNRPLDSTITGADDTKIPDAGDYQLKELTNRALKHREEFRQLKGAITAAGHAAGMHKATILPTVSAVFDYGFQGEKYNFSRNDDYWMGSLVLSWNLFKGGQDGAKRKQALYQKERLTAQQLELENQINLQVEEAYHNLDVAAKTLRSSADYLESRKETFAIVNKKFQQGMVPQIEYMKARNDFTSASVSNIIAVYDYYIKEAQLEQVSAAYVFK
ncbi:MAG: TolC family protein [bacterium]|nr:TolC family protein [bacterium]